MNRYNFFHKEVDRKKKEKKMGCNWWVHTPYKYLSTSAHGEGCGQTPIKIKNKGYLKQIMYVFANWNGHWTIHYKIFRMCLDTGRNIPRKIIEKATPQFHEIELLYLFQN